MALLPAALLLFLASTVPAAVPPVNVPTLPEPRVIGVPIRDANLIAYRVCAGYGVNGTELLCWTTTAESGGHFCALDLATGQLDLKPLGSREAYPIAAASDGAIYVGTAECTIWRYQAAGSVWEIAARPWSHTADKPYNHVRVLTQGRDGWLYCGSNYGDRARVHPSTGEVQPLPPIAEAGQWYVSSIAALPDGRIAFGLGYTARVLIHDPTTGRDVAEWAPASWRADGFIITMLAGETVLYANHFPSGRRGAFAIATGQFLGEVPWPPDKLHPKWSVWSHSSGYGNSLDYYRLPGTDTIATSDGRKIFLWDPRLGAQTLTPAEFKPAPALARELSLGVANDLRVLEYDAGRLQVVAERSFPQPPAERDLFALTIGPDGAVYGGAFQSTHLFRYDPRTGELRDLGDHHPGWSGENYSFARRGDELVCASYINGAVVLYDPARPWTCDQTRQVNPRFAGCLGEFAYRPFAIATDERGRVWGVGQAGWGLTGGGISWLDPDSGETGTTRLPLAPHAIMPLAPGIMLVADAMKLRWWDTAANTELAACNWSQGPVRDTVLLAEGGTSRIAYCDTAGVHLARLTGAGNIEAEASYPAPLAQGGEQERLLWDGTRLIAGTPEGIAELDPASGRWTRLCHTGPASRYAFAASADEIYFTQGTRLLAVKRH